MRTTKLLKILVLMLAVPLGMVAQSFESGTSKVGSVSSKVSDVWFTITLPEDGQVDLTFEPLGNTSGENLSIYAVVDGEKDRRAFAWVDGENRTLTCPNLKPGTYKVLVHANVRNNKVSGRFRLHYTFTAPFYKTDPTPNATWDDCPLLTDGVTLDGHMGYAYGNADIDNVDWFKIEVPKDGKLTFELWSAPTLTIGFAELCALNADSTKVERRNGKWLDYPDSTLVFEIPEVSVGTYYLYLPRRYGYGIYHLTPRFTPVVVDSEPELNDTWQTATLLNDGQRQNAHLGYYCNQSIYNDNVDWFKVVVPEDGKLTFETRSASTLTLGYAELCALKPGDTNVTRRNGKWLDYPDSTLVFEIPDVSEGTYYFYMPRRYGYGDYYLTYYFTSHKDEADPEPNNTWDTAIALRSGPAVTGQLGYDYKDTKDTQDWYKLNVPEEGTINLTVISEKTLTLGYAEIHSLNTDGIATSRRNGKWLDNPGDTLTFTLSNCAAGDYYLYLPLRYGYGTYYLRYNFTSCSRQNDAEPNNEYTKASELARGTVMDARLGYDYNNSLDNKDWFKLNVPEEGAINLTIQSEKTLTLGYAEIHTLNADGKSTGRRTGEWLDHPGDTLTFTLSNCAAGDYYLYMPHRYGYGGYTMRYDFVPCAIANDKAGNDTWENATPMEAGTTTEARLGYDYNNSLDNKDWFKLNVPEEGIINLTIQSEKTLTIGYAEIHTLNADGKSTGRRTGEWLDHPGDTLTFTLNNCAAGDYYLYMPHRGGYGGYTVKYDFIPCAYANDVANNDSKDTATPIGNGTITQARLGYDYNNSLDNKDWFEFTMESDGSASFTIQSEPTLTLGYAEILAPTVDGTGTNRREGKWLDIPDSALVMSANNLAAGTYYLYIPHRGGYGGYSVKSNFTKNPYFHEEMKNTDFASNVKLELGKSVSGTLGYEYNTGAQTQAWFDLGKMHGQQIDVNVEVEQSHSLSIGIATLYIYKGDDEKGNPILQSVKNERLERSSGTISYLDKNEEDSHYIFYLPRNGGYGGYKVTLGEEGEVQNPLLAAGYEGLRVMTSGRNTVRKGVPCENPITITNTGNVKCGKFLITVAATDDIDLIGFRLPGKNGTKYIPIEDLTTLGTDDCKRTAVFLVPSLEPWESYTFTMISEGKGDIAYAKERKEFRRGVQKVSVSGNTFAVVAVMGYVASAAEEDKVDDYICNRVDEEFDLTDDQMDLFRKVLSGLEAEKNETGYAAYSIKTLLERASVAINVANLPDGICGISSYLHQYIWYWIYDDIICVFDDIDIIDSQTPINDIVASWDPNEMVGPQGIGEEHFIGPNQTMEYRILFENKAEAGDAAYRVRVSDILDENIFDLSTVKFGETSHDGVGYNWKMKREGNKLSWDIEGIELPPNVNAPEGEGYVTFTVDLKPGLADGTAIKNKAEIIFDKNFPIETNEFVNTLDLTAPITTMSEAGYDVNLDGICIKCESVDAGSGVKTYQLFASKDGADYTYEGQFPGIALYPVAQADGATYSFYILATDAVGNAEVITPKAVSYENIVTDIMVVPADQQSLPKDGRIYTIDGRYVGTSFEGLPAGTYIMGGKHVYVK